MTPPASDDDSTPRGQISLFGARETPDAFRKAIQVLHSKPKAPLNLLQRKLGDAWLKHALEHAPDDEGWWEIKYSDLSRSIGFDSKNLRYLRDSALALMRIVFEWDMIAPAGKRVTWKASVLFPEVELRPGSIRYQISSQMRERVLHPEVYALIDMVIERRFRRTASVAIWQFCVRFERVGLTASVAWQEFRDMVLGEEGADSKTFQEYKFFKNRVLLPSIAEINSESNHTIELVEAKIGRRVSTVQFQVTRKASAEPVIVDAHEIELVGEVVKLGVPPSEARKLCKMHAPDVIRAAVEYTKRRAADKKLAKLARPAAYFRQALAQGYAATDTVEVDAPAAAAGRRPARPKGANILESLNSQRAAEAKAYFNELDEGDQAKAITRYNEQQQTASLRVLKRPSKMAQAAFYAWLAMETWGEPTQEELLEHAQRMLAQAGAS